MSGVRVKTSVGLTLLSAMVLVYIGAQPLESRAGAPSTYSVDFYTVSAGGNMLHGSCYRLSGTVGQAAPGYSSGSIYALIAGYWQSGATVATDEIFFSGFEGC